MLIVNYVACVLEKTLNRLNVLQLNYQTGFSNECILIFTVLMFYALHGYIYIKLGVEDDAQRVNFIITEPSVPRI